MKNPFARERKPALRALQLICSVPWAITEPALRQLMEIANRDQADVALALARLEERRMELDAVMAHDGRPLDAADTVAVRDGVAILPVEGPIVRYASLFSAISGATSVETMALDLRTALENPNVTAVLLHVDSPGGEVAGIAEFAEMLAAERGGPKPIWAYVGQDACSAAYWIAAACQRIVVAQTAVVGSIGCVAAIPNPKSGRQPPSIEFVSSQSPNKRPDPTTEAGKAQIQAMVDELGGIFVNAVARLRGVTAETVMNDFGAGGVLVGERAVEAGMVDALGSFEGCIAELSGQALPAPEPTPPPARPARRQSMSALDKLRGFVAALDPSERAELEGGDADAPTVAAEPTVTTSPTAIPVPAPTVTRARAAAESTRDPRPEPAPSGGDGEDELARARRELLVLRQRNEELVCERIQVEATAFVDQAIRDGQSFPGEREAWIAAYAQAALDDLAIGAIRNADGTTTSRVALLQAGFAARPKHLLATEQLAPDLVKVLQTRQTPARPNDPGASADPERVRTLIGVTPLGRSIQAAGRNGSGGAHGKE